MASVQVMLMLAGWCYNIPCVHRLTAWIINIHIGSDCAGWQCGRGRKTVDVDFQNMMSAGKNNVTAFGNN
jgi:hypothetical protein